MITSAEERKEDILKRFEELVYLLQDAETDGTVFNPSELGLISDDLSSIQDYVDSLSENGRG